MAWPPRPLRSISGSKLALVGVSAGAAIVAAVAVTLVADGGEGQAGTDPCTAVMTAPDEAADPLASAGVRGLEVSSRLVREFPPRSLSCAGTSTPSESRVRGVFVELADDSAATVAVYAAIHPAEKSGDWRAYLRGTFQSELDFYERGNGSILAVTRRHPRLAQVVAAYEDVSRVTPLWQALAPLR